DGFYQDLDGLYLLVRRNGGSKSWGGFYNGRPFGEQRNQRFTIGPAQGRKKVSIRDAKRAWLDALNLIDKGINPFQHKKDERSRRFQAASERKASVSLGEAILEFIQGKIDDGAWTPGTGKQIYNPNPDCRRTAGTWALHLEHLPIMKMNAADVRP